MEGQLKKFQWGTRLATVLQTIIGLYFVKNVASFYPCPKYLSEGKLESLGLILFANDFGSTMKMSKQGKRKYNMYNCREKDHQGI